MSIVTVTFVGGSTCQHFQVSNITYSNKLVEITGMKGDTSYRVTYIIKNIISVYEDVLTQ